MKILLIVDSYFPSPKSAAKLLYDLAQELLRLGHEPTILTSSESVSGPFELVVEDQVPVLRVRMPELKTPSRVLRALREARLPFVVWRRAKSVLKTADFDLIAFYSPTIFWGILVARLKFLFDCPAYLFLRDIFPQWALDAGLLRKGPAYYFFRAFELFQYSVSDVIAVQTHKDLDYFEKQPSWFRKKLEVVYNWAPGDEGEIPFRNFRGKFGLENKTIFFFGGTFGHAQKMDSIIRLAISLRNESSIAFLLVGSGTESQRMKTWIAKEKLTNIQIFQSVGQREYLSLVSEIDVGLVSLAAELRTHNVPGKSLSYAYFSKPILASLNPGAELGTLIKQFEAGRVCEAGDEELFRAHALELASNPGLRNRLGANNRRLLETKFSVAPAVEALLRAGKSR